MTNVLAVTLSQLATLEERGDIATQWLEFLNGELMLTGLLSYEEDGQTKWGATTTPIPLEQAFLKDRDLLDYLWSGEVFDAPEPSSTDG